MPPIEIEQSAPLMSLCDFDRIIREHHRCAFRFAYRMTGNREDAEDLTQDAFLRAYRARDRYDGARPFDRWLYRIIANLFVDRLRTRPRTVPLSLDLSAGSGRTQETYAEIADEDADPSRLVLRDIVDEELQRALNALPMAFRQTVLLTDVEGLSYEDAADVLDCAVGTVRSRLHRARRLMRTHLSAGAASRDLDHGIVD